MRSQFRATFRIALLSAALSGAACNTPSTPPVQAPPSSPPASPAPTTVDPAGPIAVRSADGAAALTIPDGALPSGVTPSDIRLTRLSEADAPMQIAGRPAKLAYRLEPDGTRFLKPVSIALTGVAGGSSHRQAHAALVPSNGAPPQWLDTDTAYEAGADEATVTTVVSHFSTLIVSLGAGGSTGSDVYTLSLAAPATVGVGESFSATATTTWLTDKAEIKAGGRAWTYTLGRRILNGQFGAAGLTPTEIRDAPPDTAMGSSFTAKGSFSCPRPGAASLGYFASVRFDTSVAGPDGPITNTVRDHYSVRDSVQCVAQDGPKVTPTTPSTSVKALPRVDSLKATLHAPVTTYTVTATDPDGGQLSYTWKMVGEACGTPVTPWTQTGPTAHWSHSSNPPDSCKHASTDHDVITTVTVTTSKGVSVQCTIPGTEDLELRNPKCN